ncbi:hypothetical protein ACOMHN_021039 [Nucella lapillus]
MSWKTRSSMSKQDTVKTQKTQKTLSSIEDWFNHQSQTLDWKQRELDYAYADHYDRHWSTGSLDSRKKRTFVVTFFQAEGGRLMRSRLAVKATQAGALLCRRLFKATRVQAGLCCALSDVQLSAHANYRGDKNKDLH